MRPANNIHALIKKLHLKASAELNKKVHDDISAALAESQKIESAVTQLNIWRGITEGRLTKLAVAAAILFAFGIGFFTGRWSKLARSEPHYLDVTGYTTLISVYPTSPKAEDSFWRQKALAAMQPRPYAQTFTTKAGLLNAYKQYLKEKYHD